MKTTVENGKPTTAAAQARPSEFVVPEVNIFETKDGYIVQAEMAGVSKDGLEITVEGNELTIEGRRTPESPISAEILFRERRLVDYRRTFELDPAVDTANVTAKIEQGIVTVILPKSEKVKPRKIVVD